MKRVAIRPFAVVRTVDVVAAPPAWPVPGSPGGPPVTGTPGGPAVPEPD